MAVAKKIRSVFSVYGSDDTKEIFEQNEIQSNDLVSYVLLASAVVLAVSWVLNLFGIFTIDKTRMNILSIQGLAELIVTYILYKIFNGKKRWLKYVMVIAFLLVCTRLFSVLNHNVILIMVLPVLLSSRYFSKGFTLNIALISIVMLALASFSTIFYGVIDLNFYPNPAEGSLLIIHDNLRSTVTAIDTDFATIVFRVMVHGFLPRLLVFGIISMISVLIAKHGHKMVIEQAEISRASASAKSELNTATQIQQGMVPTIFPAFPDNDEFDIYAAMHTAREVGGDFYDFFLIDDNHLAMVIADVSGKGIPAALFMMASKILISDRAMMGGTPSEILSFVNERICSNNVADMFVTVWLGILEIDSGKVIAANAGHEYPAVRKIDGEFEVLKDRHGFVLGGISGVKFSDYEFTLREGESLFVYTDGIPEAHNNNEELFGTERMTAALNINPSASPKDIINNVANSVSDFVGEAERFDDLTMLCLKYNGKKRSPEPATSENT